MKRFLAGIAAVSVMLTAPIARASDNAPSPGSPKYCKDNPNASSCIKATSSGDSFDLSKSGSNAGTGGSDSTPAANGKPVVLPDTYTIYDYSPTCSGNSRTDADVLCGAAVNICRPQGQGLINYWRWEATVSRATGKVLDPPGWVQDPGAYCLGPSVPGLPPVAAIGGILADDFQRLVVLRGKANVEPSGATLVNYQTGYYTEAGEYVLDPVQILGRRVVVTAIPQRYDWYFGDRTSALDAGPGRRGTMEVNHTYATSGRVAPYVVITWRGTYTVDGGASQPVFGSAQTTGPGTPLQVKQARAELVSR